MSVVRLTDLCRVFVRQWMLDELEAHVQELNEKLTQTRTRLSESEQALSEARDKLAAAEKPTDGDEKKKRQDRRAEREAQKAEREVQKAKAEIAKYRQAANDLRGEVGSVESALKEAEARRDAYRNDPYTLSGARDGKINDSEFAKSPAVEALTP